MGKGLLREIFSKYNVLFSIKKESLSSESLDFSGLVGHLSLILTKWKCELWTDEAEFVNEWNSKHRKTSQEQNSNIWNADYK